MAAALRFWLRRGVDGFRLDAIDRLLKDPELRDDPPASGPPALPELGEAGTLEHVHSRNAPDIGLALAALRGGAGDGALLVGEVYLPAAQLAPVPRARRLRLRLRTAARAVGRRRVPGRDHGRARSGGAAGRVAWVLSNHDFPRLPDRVGARNARAAALLALTLPGAVFVYQGDEIGMADGPGGDPPHDRAGRDRHRHPMRWDDDAPHGGFTEPRRRRGCRRSRSTAAASRSRRAIPTRCSRLYRDLIAARRALGAGLTLRRRADDGVLAYRRGDRHVVAINMGDAPRAAPAGRRDRARDARRAPSGGRAGARELQPGRGLPVAEFDS